LESDPSGGFNTDTELLSGGSPGIADSLQRHGNRVEPPPQTAPYRRDGAASPG
jgi:hypothetical protein